MAFYYEPSLWNNIGEEEVASHTTLWTEGDHTGYFWEGDAERSGGSGGTDGSNLPCLVSSGETKHFIAGVKTFSAGLTILGGGTFMVIDKKTDGYSPKLTFDGAATIENSANLFVFSGGELTLNAPEEPSSAPNVNNGAITIKEGGVATVNSMENSGTVNVTSSGTLDLSGTWTNAEGGTLNIQTGGVTSMTGTMENSGTVDVNNATLDFNGTWTNAEGGILEMLTGGVMSMTGTMTNNGSASVNNATLNLNGIWTNAEGKKLEMLTNGVVNVASGGGINGAFSMDASSLLVWNSTADAFSSASISININNTAGLKKIIDAPDGVTLGYASAVVGYDNYISSGSLVKDTAGDLWYMAGSPKILYVNDTYSGSKGNPVDDGKYLYLINAFTTFDAAVAKAEELATVEEYDITGGTLTSSVYADGKRLKIIGGVSGSGAYAYGGAISSAIAGSVEVDAASVALKAVVGGSSVVFTSATTGSTVGLVAGGNKITTSSTVSGNTQVTINGNVTVSNFTIGGSFQAGETEVSVTGDSELKIAAGTYGSIKSDGTVNGVVTGGGFLQNSTDASAGAYTQNGSVNVTISGGTINTVLFAAGASRKKVGEGQMTVTGSVNVTIDCSANEVGLYEVYAGFNGNGTIGGDTTMTFTGKGENLTFAKIAGKTYNGVFGDNGGIESGAADRTLVFDDFKGDFTANNIKKFDTVKFTNGSEVTFTQSGLNLSPVTTWDFAFGTSLDWKGDVVFNSLAGDTLYFGTSGDASELTAGSSWEVMTAKDVDAFDGWNSYAANADDNTKVSIFGNSATYNGTVWATSDYQLAYDGSGTTKKLVISAVSSQG